MTAVDKGLLWMAYPDSVPGIRVFVLDCPHATTKLRLWRSDDRDDPEILTTLVDQHHAGFNATPDARDEQCACEPVANRVTGVGIPRPKKSPEETMEQIRRLVQ